MGYQQHINASVTHVSLPANMCDIYSGIGLDFYTVLVPGPPHGLIRHLTLKHRLILRLHREVCNALVDLQVFLYRKKHKLRLQITETISRPSDFRGSATV